VESAGKAKPPPEQSRIKASSFFHLEFVLVIDISVPNQCPLGSNNIQWGTYASCSKFILLKGTTPEETVGDEILAEGWGFWPGPSNVRSSVCRCQQQSGKAKPSIRFEEPFDTETE